MNKKEEKAKMAEKLISAKEQTHLLSDDCDDLELSDRELDMIAGGVRGGNSPRPCTFFPV